MVHAQTPQEGATDGLLDIVIIKNLKLQDTRRIYQYEKCPLYSHQKIFSMYKQWGRGDERLS